MDLEKLREVAEGLQQAEDEFLGRIERYPQLIKEPDAVDIMHRMRTAIVNLSAATQPAADPKS